MALVTIAALFAAGCQKYDDSDLRKQLQELREKLSSLEAWCSSSQSAIDAVAVLQKAVENMNSVESIDPFIDADGATGYVITFTDKQTVKLYNGEDGEAFFGNVVDKVYWRNTGKVDHFSKDRNNYIYFVFGEKKIASRGNIMSLLDKDCRLTAIPSDYCFAYLFWGSRSLTLGPELPAETLTEGCYDSMFYKCQNLSSIKVAFTDWGDGSATPEWVTGVAAEGNFECPEGLEIKYGDNNIPAGWSVNSVAPAATKRN